MYNGNTAIEDIKSSVIINDRNSLKDENEDTGNNNEKYSKFIIINIYY